MRPIKIVENSDDLGKALRSTRKERRIVQQDLADVIGLSRTAVIDLETGKSKPYFETVQKAAVALGYRIALVPLEAVPYIKGYEPTTTEEEFGEEVGDEGISGSGQ